jgi:hypothetical protein
MLKPELLALALRVWLHDSVLAAFVLVGGPLISVALTVIAVQLAWNADRD